MRVKLCVAFLVALAFAPLARAESAVVVIHGGGWWTGSPTSMVKVCEALGPVDCFTPSYTLSMEAPYPAANRDLKGYVAALREQGYRQVIAVGVSAGGNLAAWLASRGLVDGCVVWSAISDLRTIDWWRKTPGWVVRRFAPTARKRQRGSPSVRGVQVPMLILHSLEERIPLDQAQALATVSPLGELVVFPGTAHGMGMFDQAMPLTAAWVQART